jgi:Fe-S-cluster containining protein
MSESMRSLLPELYHSFLPELFDLPTPKQTLSTCDHCAMTCPTQADDIQTTEVKQGYFSPNVKCCSFFPKIPNFLVGALLNSIEPELQEGRERMKKKIRSRIGITPGWVGPTRKYRLLFEAARSSSFGRSRSLLCPFFIDESGLCSIWKFREIDCSTFFCKHDHGQDSLNVWHSLEYTMSLVEETLATYAMRTVLQLPDAYIARKKWKIINHISQYELENRPPPEQEYKRLWFQSELDEVEYYKQCFQVISTLTKEEFSKLVQDAEDIHSAFQQLEKLQRVDANKELPTSLIVNPHARMMDINNEHTLFVAYRKFHPVTMVSEIKEVIAYFSSARKVKDVQQEIFEKENIEIPDDIFLLLYQMRILTTERELDARN